MNGPEGMLDFASGQISGPPTSVRTVGDLAELFQETHGAVDPSQVVYETYGCPSVDSEPAVLLYATTVLHPGQIGCEYFMTRGHFHTRPERGELCLTLAGRGLLMLMDRDREPSYEWMSPGSIHNIDGRLAHRVVNVGEEPLTFFVTWMSDCGHDYESIRERGFSLRVFSTNGEPTLVPQ